MARHTPGAGDDEGVTPGHEPFAPPASDDDAVTVDATDAAGPRLVAWSHPGTSGSATTSGAASAASADPVGATVDDQDDEPAPRSGRRRLAVIGGVVAAAALVAVAVSAVLFTNGSAPLAAGAPTGSASPTTIARTSTPTPSASPSPMPTAPATPSPRAATPPPEDAAVPAPFITPVPAGTVVAESDVASPKGSIHFHYRVVATGDGTYTTDVTDFTSSLPVPVGVSFYQVAPSVGDGITFGGDGGSEIGGPTATPASASWSFGAVTQPSYLSTLVVHSTSTSPDVPVEISAGKVLAVAPVAWSVPPRGTNIAPVDSGAVAFATGALEATTASGSPKRYTVAPDDLIDAVARRFGISVSALLYMNQGLQVIDDAQHLFAGTTLVLDPDSV
ncbi:LysM peptidoglycan-binding domain-containing protein [Frigoribacterium sp. CFBP 8759]|uniref:LysM peptidoglycan-binding domain-containing protein n=1 Tax=Frigoribacterium sp. CFBP 8759 TaxID=2775283 RepID=UPI00177D3981|nr:LysM domain-containing protein [Frigoribacterium sp. CFBP 8759]MBD8486362.1 LysM peptidoglycan-binding domain-containing protein [Frigoribacterium sp. CFBP 8759]